MTQDKVKDWLISLCEIYNGHLTKDADFPEILEKRIVDWIIEALNISSYTINVDKIKRDTPKGANLNEILCIVAYNIPDLPLELRKEKPLLFNFDVNPFYSATDEEWKELRTIFCPKSIADDGTKYLLRI